MHHFHHPTPPEQRTVPSFLQVLGSPVKFHVHPCLAVIPHKHTLCVIFLLTLRVQEFHVEVSSEQIHLAFILPCKTQSKSSFHNGRVGFECINPKRVFMWRHIKPILQVIILTTTMLVSFLYSLVLENTTKCPRTFYLVHNHDTNYNCVTRILRP